MQPTCLITGASSGIGAEFAKQVALSTNYTLLLIARRIDRLKNIREVIKTSLEAQNENKLNKIHLLSGDLLDPNFLHEIVNYVDKNSLFVELLINNAGFGTVGSFFKNKVDREIQMVRLNCEVPIKLSHSFIPEMLNKKRGSVINVCSTAAFQAVPYMSTYAATKAFLLSHSLGLNRELKHFNINVLAHCPGPTDTEFHLVAGLEQKMSHLPAMKVENVVSEALLALSKGKAIVVNGRLNKFLALLTNFLPKSLTALIVQRILRHSV
jgi:short-subunit dehydrogenase